MKVIITVIIVSIGICFFSCNYKTNAEVIFNEYQNPENTKRIDSSQPIDSVRYSERYTSFFYFYINEKPSIISGKLNGNNYGHTFYFSKKGSLDKYEFTIGRYNSYMVERNNINNEYIETGNSYVDYMPSLKAEGSKYCYYFLFSAFPRKSIQPSVAIINTSFAPLFLKKSTLFPMLLEGEVYLQAGDTIVLKTEATKLAIKLNGLKDSIISYDTIVLRPPPTLSM